MRNFPKGLAILSSMAMWTAQAMAEEARNIPLPPDLAYPEGIAFDETGHIYTASALDGTVVRTSLRDGKSSRLSEARKIVPEGSAFPAVLGMKIDRSKRLWIAGGATGKVIVLDRENGKPIKEMTVEGQGGVLNDLAFAGDAAYVTDTRRPILWRISVSPNGQIGQPEPWLDLKSGPIPYGDGPGLNGIAATSDGTALIVVHMGKGQLFRIDVKTKEITEISVGGEVIAGGDGLVLDGRTLYLVRQPHAEIVTLSLSSDLRSAKVVSRFTDKALTWPATAAKIGDTLYVVDSQFNKRQTNTPSRPFNVVAIPTSALEPRPRP